MSRRWELDVVDECWYVQYNRYIITKRLQCGVMSSISQYQHINWTHCNVSIRTTSTSPAPTSHTPRTLCQSSPQRCELKPEVQTHAGTRSPEMFFALCGRNCDLDIWPFDLKTILLVGYPKVIQFHCIPTLKTLGFYRHTDRRGLTLYLYATPVVVISSIWRWMYANRYIKSRFLHVSAARRVWLEMLLAVP